MPTQANLTRGSPLHSSNCRLKSSNSDTEEVWFSVMTLTTKYAWMRIAPLVTAAWVILSSDRLFTKRILVASQVLDSSDFPLRTKVRPNYSYQVYMSKVPSKRTCSLCSLIKITSLKFNLEVTIWISMPVEIFTGIPSPTLTSGRSEWAISKLVIFSSNQLLTSSWLILVLLSTWSQMPTSIEFSKLSSLRVTIVAFCQTL